MDRYYLKFAKGGKTVYDDYLGLVDPGGDVDAADDGGYYARWGEAGAAKPRCRCRHPHWLS